MFAAAALGGGAGGLIGTLLAKLLGDWHANRIMEQLEHGGLLLWVRVWDAGQENCAIQISSATRVVMFTSTSITQASIGYPLPILPGSVLRDNELPRPLARRRRVSSERAPGGRGP